MTITVTYREATGVEQRVEIDEAKHSPFDVLAAVFRRINEFGSSAGAQTPAARPAAGAGVRDASMIAYRVLEWSGRMTRQQRLVMDFLAANLQRDYTRQELSQATGLAINVICGRVNELMQEPFGLIEEIGRRRCRVTGESANALRPAGARMRVAA